MLRSLLKIRFYRPHIAHMKNNPNPHHITEFFSLPKDAAIDFFDANLVYDSPAFIDPFLLKNSPVPAEAYLFDRFGDYFRYAYDKSLEMSVGAYPRKQLRQLLTVREPKHINMGYTENSNQGHGPSLADKLLGFFIDATARRFVKETEAFPGQKYNPASMQVFTSGIGFDGISDITANLIMDYLIEYTQAQAKKWKIPLKEHLPLDNDGFDFEEMSWRGGGYYALPENPVRKGEALIFVPKRLLRGLEEVRDNTTSKVISILRADETLSVRFSSLLTKPIKDISIDEVRAVFKEDKSVHYRYLEALEEERQLPYDFKLDPLNLLADKSYAGYFEDIQLPEVKNCDDLKNLVRMLVDEFQREFSSRDGWKDAWKERNSQLVPQTEPVIGRKFRAMGFAMFRLFDEITFIPEMGTGNGFLDFLVVRKSCRVAIELKLLKNSSLKGRLPSPAYLHGITKQLPEYVANTQAKHAFYITGQHYDGTIDETKNDHPRVAEVSRACEDTEKELIELCEDFESLTYTNVNMAQRPSASNA